MTYGTRADQRMAHDPDHMFARNLAAQEVRRWQEYLEAGTREALVAWRQTRVQLGKARAV